MCYGLYPAHFFYSLLISEIKMFFYGGVVVHIHLSRHPPFGAAIYHQDTVHSEIIHTNQVI